MGKLRAKERYISGVKQGHSRSEGYKLMKKTIINFFMLLYSRPSIFRNFFSFLLLYIVDIQLFFVDPFYPPPHVLGTPTHNWGSYGGSWEYLCNKVQGGDPNKKAQYNLYDFQIFFNCFTKSLLDIELCTDSLFQFAKFVLSLGYAIFRSLCKILV